MKDIFITGTDTGVGKTVAAAAMLSVLRHDGTDAVPMKPIQTGCVTCNGSNSGKAPDIEFCLSVTGLQPAREDAESMAPCRFEPACSPHLAAAMAGRAISLESILAHFRKLKAHHDAVIVEGAGGILVPLAGDQTMLDLMSMLALPVVLVSRPGLGTINHTLLSLRELRRTGLPVLGVILCHTQPDSSGFTEIEEDNRITIERMGNVRILGRLPFMPALQKGTCSPEAFHTWAARHLDTRHECHRILEP